MRRKADGFIRVHPNAADEEPHTMLRFACVSFLFFAACAQSFDLGNRLARGDLPLVGTVETAAGSTGATGSTGPNIHPQKPPGPTSPLLGSWVKLACETCEAIPPSFLRKSFRRDGTLTESSDTGATFTYQGTRLTITDGGEDLVSTHDSVIYQTGLQYPYLALDVFRREGTGTDLVDSWLKITTVTDPNGFTTSKVRLKFFADGTASHSLEVTSSSGPQPITEPQPGTWSCTSATECEAVFNNSVIVLDVFEPNTFVDVKNDRWERAKTCETGGPITWGSEPYACPPVMYTAACDVGQTADWDGCFFTCVWPAQCDHVEASTCNSDADCASGELCTNSTVTVRKEDPALSSVYGLCIKERSLCDQDSDCTTNDFCSSAGQCEGL